jgi:hypothetical protein
VNSKKIKVLEKKINNPTVVHKAIFFDLDDFKKRANAIESVIHVNGDKRNNKAFERIKNMFKNTMINLN